MSAVAKWFKSHSCDAITFCESKLPYVFDANKTNKRKEKKRKENN